MLFCGTIRDMKQKEKATLKNIKRRKCNYRGGSNNEKVEESTRGER